MSYQPPFTITSNILNLVAEISQRVGELNASVLNASPQLRKQNRIKTITGTLAIEGNTLTEEQITALLDGKPVLGSVRELAEVKGAIAAYDALPSWSADNIDHLLAAHGLMMSDSTPFIEFMLSVISQTLSQNALVNASVNAPVNIEGMKTPEALLHLLDHNPQLTRQQLADLMAKDVRTIARALAKLQAEGRVKRVGSDKTGHWEVQP